MAMSTQRGGASGASAPGAAPSPAGSWRQDHVGQGDDFEEISLVDIMRVLYKRRVVLAVTLILALAGGAALTFFTTPEYEASAEVIPLTHGTITKNWLESRQAAAFASDTVGEALYPALYPDSWDASTQSWRGVAPTEAEVTRELLEHVSIAGGTSKDSLLTISVTLPSAVLARDVAQAYLGSLDLLRPQLEEITRAELFDKYYDGSNAQEAQARAEVAAREQSYWIVFDDPSLPNEPVKPKPLLNMALAGVLGIMGGVFVVFGLEWLSKYKAEFTRVAPPPQK